MFQQKRKRVVATIQQKIDILRQLEEGVSVKELSQKYNISKNTVHDVRKSKDKLMNYSITSSDSIYGIQHRRTMKKSPYELLHKALLQWFNRERAEGRPVNGPMCAKQAKVLFETLGLEGNFDASSGWLARFKDRHGIRTIGDSMDCLWTKIGAEKAHKINLENNSKTDESKKTDNSVEEEEILPGAPYLSSISSIDDLKTKDKPLETSEQQNEIENVFLKSRSTSSEENIREKNKMLEVKNNKIKKDFNLIDLGFLIEKLEAISEKLSRSDSYDQFGIYVTSLLRRLPKNKVLTLKQKIVNDILDTIVDHEKGMNEDYFINSNNSTSNTIVHTATETQQISTNTLPNCKTKSKSPFTFVSCNTSNVPISKTQKGEVTTQCVHKRNLSSCDPLNSNELERLMLPVCPTATDTVSKVTSGNVGSTCSSQQLKYTTNDETSTTTSGPRSAVDRTPRVNRRKFPILGTKTSTAAKRHKTSSHGSIAIANTDTELYNTGTIGTFGEDFHSELDSKSPVEDFNIDIEEGRELREIKKDEDLFESVYMDMIDINKVKEEPLDSEEKLELHYGSDCSIPPTQILLCDLCSLSCTSSKELMQHFTQLHSEVNRPVFGRPSIEPRPARLTERHFIENVPPTANKLKPQRRCAVCSKQGIRKETSYWCSECKAGLCLVDCFKDYHTKLNF